MSQILANGIVAGSIYALMAVGFALIYKTVRFFHFAHGAVYVVSAYVGWALYTKFGVPFVVCVVLACLVSGLLGAGIYLSIYRPLKQKNSPQLVFLLASFAVFVFLSGLLQLAFGGDVQVFQGLTVREGHRIGGAVVTTYQFALIVTSLITTLVLSVWLGSTRWGKAIRAVADDPLAASITGINAGRVITFVFALGSALAGLAGVLVGVETNLVPSMGFEAILKGIVAALVGGLGNIYGAVLGGLFLGVVENFGIIGISAGWKDTVAFLVLVIVLLVRPKGLINGEREQRAV